jgi:aspartate aminotransferase
MGEKIAIYPGTFDPIHNGHMEIIRRALGTFDRVIVALGLNPEKDTIFTIDERLDMIQRCISGDPRISCESFEGLLVQYAERIGATAIVRGLRAVSDFEYEFQLALMNRKLNRNIETFFLMTAHRYLYVSSRIIKATVVAGGSPAGLVPEYVLRTLRKKFPQIPSNNRNAGKHTGVAMRKILSERARLLKPSATLAIAAKEKELKSKGVDVIGFGAGEPDFPTPERIREAAKQSLDRGETFYTPVPGILELRKAVAHRFSEDYGLEYKPEEILISCGAKHSIANVFQALLDPGDEVLVFAPYWVSYPEMIGLCGARAVIVPTLESERFVPDPKRVKGLITATTKAIMVNSPSNPTGVLYPRPVLEAIAQLAEEHDLLVISDEIYDKLLYDGLPYVPFASLPGMKPRTVTINGVSKTYAMTGWRIGYLACPNLEIVKAAANIQSQSTSNPNNTAQAAAVEALSGPQQDVADMRAVFEHRRDMMIQGIEAIPGLSVAKPDGAFYAFVNVAEMFGGNKGLKDSSDVAGYLLEKFHVACVPGGPFGSEDHIRLSFATSEETIQRGLERIREAFKR